MRRYLTGRRSGFTLVELMIVIAVVVLLMAVLVASFTGVFSSRDKGIAKSTIEMLKANISSYEARWGAPPPSTLSQLGTLSRVPDLVDVNQTNTGIEAMVVALRSNREGGPYLDADLLANDERRTNLDADEMLPEVLAPEAMDIEGSPELFELVDPWGNPYVYLNMTDIRQGTIEEEIILADGSTIELDVTRMQELFKHPVTGQYPKGYVLWSFGEDGVNDYGRGDDITSWPKYDEQE